MLVLYAAESSLCRPIPASAAEYPVWPSGFGGDDRWTPRQTRLDETRSDSFEFQQQTRLESAMDFISVMAVTEAVARRRIVTEAGYGHDTVGRLVYVEPSGDNSRQNSYLFETSNDVTRHPHYAKARLSESHDLGLLGVDDGPVLVYGPEVTVGG